MPEIYVTEYYVEDLFHYLIHELNRYLQGYITIDDLQLNIWDILAVFFSELVVDD